MNVLAHLFGMLLVLAASAGPCLAAADGLAWSPRTDLALWGIVYFVLFLWVCKKLLWGWWLRSMGERERTEAERIAAAELQARQAADLLNEHVGKLEAVGEEIREILAEARRDADYTRSHILESAQAEAEAARNRALRDVGRRREQTLKEVFDTLTSRTVERTREILSTRLTDADQRRLVGDALAQFRQQAS